MRTFHSFYCSPFFIPLYVYRLQHNHSFSSNFVSVSIFMGTVYILYDFISHLYSHLKSVKYTLFLHLSLYGRKKLFYLDECG